MVNRAASPVSVIAAAQEMLAERQRQAKQAQQAQQASPQPQMPAAQRKLPPSVQQQQQQAPPAREVIDLSRSLSGSGGGAPAQQQQQQQQQQPNRQVVTTGAQGGSGAARSSLYEALRESVAVAQRHFSSPAAQDGISADVAALFPESAQEYAARQRAAQQQRQQQQQQQQPSLQRLLPASLLNAGIQAAAAAAGAPLSRQGAGAAGVMLGMGIGALSGFTSQLAGLVANGGSRLGGFDARAAGHGYGAAAGGSARDGGAAAAAAAAAGGDRLAPVSERGHLRPSGVEVQRAVQAVMEGLSIAGDQERDPPEVRAREIRLGARKGWGGGEWGGLGGVRGEEGGEEACLLFCVVGIDRPAFEIPPSLLCRWRWPCRCSATRSWRSHGCAGASAAARCVHALLGCSAFRPLTAYT